MEPAASTEILPAALPTSGEISAIDKKLIGLLGPNRSPWEISEELGGIYTPQEVFQRTQEILHQRNWLSVLQLKLLMIDKAWGLLDKFSEFGNDGSTKAAQIALNAMKELRALLDEDTESIHDAMLRISAEQAKVMGKAVNAGFAIFVQIMDLDPLEAQAAMEEALPLAFARIDAELDEEARLDLETRA